MFPVALLTSHDQNTLEKNRLVWLPLPSHSLSLKEVKAGPQDRSLKTETMEKHCFQAHSLACSQVYAERAFFIQPRHICLGKVLPTVGWAHPHQPSVKIISHRRGQGPTSSEQPSTEVPSSQVILSCVTLVIKANQHKRHGGYL